MSSEERPISAMVDIFIGFCTGFFWHRQIACPGVHIIIIFIP